MRIHIKFVILLVSTTCWITVFIWSCYDLIKPLMLDRNDSFKYKSSLKENQNDSNRNGSTSTKLSCINVTLTIPRIIHQVWDGYNVPGVYHSWIKSCVRYNPTWEYWFWTVDDVRTLIRTRYPRYLKTFDSYQDPIFQTDAMRYFVLYTYGGFYIDLDVHCLRSFDPWLEGYGCVASYENPEHAYLVQNISKPNVMTTVLGCRAGHPFYRQLIKALPAYARIYNNNVFKATGPIFLDRQYHKYMKIINNLTCGIEKNDVKVFNSKYFLNWFDPDQVPAMKNTCNGKKYLSKVQRRLCAVRKQTNWGNTIYKDAYSVHYWLHVNIRTAEWKQRHAKHILQIIPTVRNVSQILLTQS